MPDSHPDSAATSIVKGVDDLIDSALRLKGVGKAPQHKHQTSCRQLTKSAITGFDASGLIAEIYEKVRQNWDNSKSHSPSKENWRFEKQKYIGDKNQSREVILERAIVNIPEEIWPDAACWVNQVPVASGLVGSDADRRRSIDLVHKCGDKAYEFIELKVGSDTPLYAAMEILKYGVLYIFCRQDERVSKYVDRKRKLLQAEKIHLRVLAPVKYYEKYDLSWLEKCIKNGLADFLAQRKFAFEMDFKFETLPLIPSRSPVTWRVKA